MGTRETLAASIDSLSEVIRYIMSQEYSLSCDPGGRGSDEYDDELALKRGNLAVLVTARQSLECVYAKL